MKLRIISFCFLLLAAFLSGCSDGGTDGTGVQKTLVVGKVSDTAGEPFQNAETTILETGDSAVTDSKGQFQLSTIRGLDRLTFAIKRSDTDVTAVLADLPPTASIVEVEIAVNNRANTAEAQLIMLTTLEKLELSVSIIGGCRNAFQYSDGEFVQLKELPNETPCRLKATVRGDGQLTGGVKVAVQRRPCRTNATWITSEVGITHTREGVGTVEIPFTFFNTERACQYRVFAPFGQESESSDTVRIRTLQERAREKD